MSANVGKNDRTVRLTLGIACFTLFFITAGNVHWLGLAGIALLITGIIGSCPVYALLGLNTCNAESAPVASDEHVD